MVDDSKNVFWFFCLPCELWHSCVAHRQGFSYALKKPQAGCQKTDGTGSFCSASHCTLRLAAFVITAAMEFQWGSCQCRFLLLDIASRTAQHSESYKSRQVLKNTPKKLIWNIFKCAWVTPEMGRGAEHEQNYEIVCALQYLLGYPSVGALVCSCN